MGGKAADTAEQAGDKAENAASTAGSKASSAVKEAGGKADGTAKQAGDKASSAADQAGSEVGGWKIEWQVGGLGVQSDNHHSTQHHVHTAMSLMRQCALPPSAVHSAATSQQIA